MQYTLSQGNGIRKLKKGRNAPSLSSLLADEKNEAVCDWGWCFLFALTPLVRQ